MPFVRWIVGCLIALFTVTFAVLNLDPVSVRWSPFHATFEIPLYIVGLCLMALGFLTGALIVWLNGDPLGLKNHRQRKTIKNLEKELETLHEEGGSDTKAPVGDIMALLSRPK